MSVVKNIRSVFQKICDNYSWFSAVAMEGKRGEQLYYYRKSLRNQKKMKVSQ